MYQKKKGRRMKRDWSRAKRCLRASLVILDLLETSRDTANMKAWMALGVKLDLCRTLEPRTLNCDSIALRSSRTRVLEVETAGDLRIDLMILEARMAAGLRSDLAAIQNRKKR